MGQPEGATMTEGPVTVESSRLEPLAGDGPAPEAAGDEAASEGNMGEENKASEGEAAAQEKKGARPSSRAAPKSAASKAAASRKGGATKAPAKGEAEGEANETAAGLSGPYTLCIDIGGTGVKAIVLDQAGQHACERQRIETPKPATPEAVLAVIDKMLAVMPVFDRVSVGFPGVVKHGVVFTAPNLDPSWAKVPLASELEKRTAKPTRVLNDAGVQGYGAITGKGVEMILTLGTGMGCALFVDGVYAPNIELAHHPFDGKRTYEQYISNEQLKKIGKRKWNKRVRKVIDQVLPIFNPDVLYLGGGNARALKPGLPESVRVVENIAGLLGGLALWKFQ